MWYLLNDFIPCLTPDKNLSRTTFGLFVAGTDTTGTAMQWFMLHMLHFPDAQKKVAQHLDRESKGCYTSQRSRRRWLNIWTENRKGATLPRGPEEGRSTSGQRIERVLHFPEAQKKVGQHLDRESKGCYTSQRSRRRWLNIWTENRKGATLPRGPEEGGSTSGQRIERVLHFPEVQKKVAQHLDRESKGCYTSQTPRRRWLNIWTENRKGATLPRGPEEGGSTSGQRIERVLHFPEVQKKVDQHLDRESKGCYTSQRSRRRWVNIWTENRKSATLPRGPEEGGSTSGQRIDRVLHFPEVQKKVGQHLDRESKGARD